MTLVSSPSLLSLAGHLQQITLDHSMATNPDRCFLHQQIESLLISLEASRAGHHWLHQESELVLANVRQWVKEQK